MVKSLPSEGSRPLAIPSSPATMERQCPRGRNLLLMGPGTEALVPKPPRVVSFWPGVLGTGNLCHHRTRSAVWFLKAFSFDTSTLLGVQLMQISFPNNY